MEKGLGGRLAGATAISSPREASYSLHSHMGSVPTGLDPNLPTLSYESHSAPELH